MLEDIVKILIDMLIEKGTTRDEITLRLRQYHLCIYCLKHYRECICDENEDSSSSVLSDYTSSIVDSYDSSE
jgi:hypothetical protein